MKKKSPSLPVIHRFFDTFHLADAQQLLRKAITTADSTHAWPQGQGADLLYFMEWLEIVLVQAFAAGKPENRIRAGVLPKAAPVDITQTDQYCGGLAKHKPWHCFPRFLCEAEFRNPYLAIQKLTGYAGKKEWKQLLRQLRAYALSNHRLTEADDGTEPVQAWVLLAKMLDALHLLYIRSL